MVTRVAEKQARSKNMYARVKADNFKWIHQAAKQTKRSVSDYVDTLIEQLRAGSTAKRASTNGSTRKRAAPRAARTALASAASRSRSRTRARTRN